MHSQMPRLPESRKTLVLSSVGLTFDTSTMVHNVTVSRKCKVLNLINRLSGSTVYCSFIAKLAATYISHTRDHEQVFITVTSTYYLKGANTETDNVVLPALDLLRRRVRSERNSTA